MKTVLITGGSGFLGGFITKRFNDANKFNVISTGSQTFNLFDLPTITYTLEQRKVDIVVHAAAKCGGIGLNQRQPADLTRDNLQMSLNIMEACRIAKINKLYVLGSVCSYPVNCPVPFQEDNLFAGYPELTNSGYGNSKRMLFDLHDSYRQQYGLTGAKLIPVNLYGPEDHFDLENSHVIPALINKFIKEIEVCKIIRKVPQVNCWGTGTASREFFYAEDCAEAIFQAVNQELDTILPINLGTGKEITIKALTELIAELTNFKGNIVFTGEVSDGQPRRCLDVSRAKEMLGFEAKTDIRTGLIKTIEWYQKNK